MTEAARDLFERAKALPPAERAALADALYATLEEPASDEDLAAERAELERRILDVEEGRVKPVPFDEALAQVRAHLARSRATQ